MKLSPEIENRGLRAFEQVRAFERLRRKRVPLIYGAFSLSIIIGGFAALMMDRADLAQMCLGGAALFSICAWINWRTLTRRHAENLEILAELEATHGDALPWIQVENHLAAVAQLERDLETEKKRAEAAKTAK